MSMLEEEPLAPGEVALDDVPDTIASTITTSAEPAIDTSALEPEPAAVVAPVKAEKTGVLAEMIEHRTVRKQLETEKQAWAPVLSRLTPEMQQAIVEGRVLVKPAATTTEGRNEQLEATAKRLDLYKDDGAGNRVLDTGAAAKVESYVRDTARAEVAPLKQEALNKEAQYNLNVAVGAAKAHGYDDEGVAIIRQTFENALRAPNGAAMLANADVSKQLWFSGVGQATAAGKMPKATKAAPVERQGAPTAIVAEATGRRGPTAGVQLTPAVQAIYKQHGMDPAKAHSATHKIDMSQGVTLE